MNFLLETVLSSKYTFIPVADVYHAMNELKRREQIELIIVDLDFHTEENLDFVQHIQTSSLYQDTPVIMLSSSKNISKRDFDLSVCDFFYKPFSPLDMLSRIDDLVHHKYIKVN